MISLSELNALLLHELEIIGVSSRRRALEAILVAPVLRTRRWDYGEADDRFACWVVAAVPEKGIELVYCDEGFGPEFPWGFLFSDDDSLGMDAQWNWYLEEAFVRSGLWTGATGGSEHEAFHPARSSVFPAHCRLPAPDIPPAETGVVLSRFGSCANPCAAHLRGGGR
ncbi:MAG: hypothetical protein KY467_04805 [Gemmatimonadetes bacterium]|nr:hypothetical protein [Gemmatimonadota bacterium]